MKFWLIVMLIVKNAKYVFKMSDLYKLSLLKAAYVHHRKQLAVTSGVLKQIDFIACSDHLSLPSLVFWSFFSVFNSLKMKFDHMCNDPPKKLT